MGHAEILKGKTCLITGATSGIGKAAAIELARMGAAVTVVGRDRSRGEAALGEIKQKSGSAAVDLLLADFTSRRSIRALVEGFKARHAELHVLVNNAGVAVRHRTLTEDGLETTFAVNHLGYYFLTNLLLDRLLTSAPARIINVSSSAHRGGQLDFDDLQGERRYLLFPAYSASKLANILFTYELARRLEGKGVTVNCLHPGVIPNTNLAREMPWIFNAAVTVVSRALFFGISPEQGAKSIVYLASSSEVGGVTGKYFVQCKAVRSSGASYDREAAARLWKVSAQLTGVG